MSENEIGNLTRRKMLGLASAPLAAAALAALPRGVMAQAGPGASAAAGGNDLVARVYNVRDFGAKGDGEALDSGAIQKAIDACAADKGGTVLVPAGDFLIAPIVLKSHVTLHIAGGATLLAVIDGKLYPTAPGIPLRGDHTMGDGNVGLITGANAVNVTIEGNGTIDGRGAEVRAAITGDAKLGGNRRCHLFLFHQCENLCIRNVYMYRSGYHTCRISNSSHVLLDGIRINSRVTGNNDGFHFISASFVNMTNCNVRCQDDACALFGSCKFITITNCSFSTRWSCFRFGGGTAENIAVSNCLMYQVLGCPIKLRCEAGSRYENMSFANLIFKDVTGPISLGAGMQRAPGENGKGKGKARERPSAGDGATSGTMMTAGGEPIEPGEDPARGIIRNISFSNISGTVVSKPTKLDDSTFSGGGNIGEQHSAIILNCVEGNLIENISFDNISLTFGGGGTAEEGARRELPNIAGEYYALGPIPAYGFYSRNARGLTLNNVRFQVATPDLRPAVVLDGVQDVSIFGLAAQANPAAESLVRLQNCADTLIASPRVLTPGSVFLRVEGADSKAITIDGGDLSKAQTPLEFAGGARQDSVKLRV